MRGAVRAGLVAIALTALCGSVRPVLAVDAESLAARSIAECERGRRATDREAREAAFLRGLELAEAAVEANDDAASAHFGIFCNKGELLRIDGEKISSVLEFRTVMRELDRTLAIDPGHLQAMASKGILLMRLPRLLGGNASAGEAMLRAVVARDPGALASRLELAERCRTRGELDEARTFAGRALEIANERGLVDKVEEAEATLAKIDSSR